MALRHTEPGRRRRVVPANRARSMQLIRSLGKRRSPHHRFPKLVTWSVVCQRAPSSSVPTGTGSPHSRLVGPQRPTPLHWALRVRGRPLTNLNKEITARGRVSRLLVGRAASPSTHGSRSCQLSAVSDQVTTTSWTRRLASHRSFSNASPDCITLSSSGTSFRASVQTAFVPAPPLRAFRAR